uniref:Uncharacterized protein n=1 Tax=Lygus hesperus TaxID=30085 RepID=A0A146LWA2_LYGHE
MLLWVSSMESSAGSQRFFFFQRYYLSLYTSALIKTSMMLSSRRICVGCCWCCCPDAFAVSYMRLALPWLTGDSVPDDGADILLTDGTLRGLPRPRFTGSYGTSPASASRFAQSAPSMLSRLCPVYFILSFDPVATVLFFFKC